MQQHNYRRDVRRWPGETVFEPLVPEVEKAFRAKSRYAFGAANLDCHIHVRTVIRPMNAPRAPPG
jgi:hypothetical protein